MTMIIPLITYTNKILYSTVSVIYISFFWSHLVSSDIVSINGLTMILKIIDQCDVKHIMTFTHRHLCRVKNMLAKYLKYHKAGLTPTTPVTSIAISPVKMSIGRKLLSNLGSEMIFLQGKPVFYIFLPSTPPYWQIILRFCWHYFQT
jgi:hypothetical protein